MTYFAFYFAKQLNHQKMDPIWIWMFSKLWVPSNHPLVMDNNHDVIILCRAQEHSTTIVTTGIFQWLSWHIISIMTSPSKSAMHRSDNTKGPQGPQGRLQRCNALRHCRPLASAQSSAFCASASGCKARPTTLTTLTKLTTLDWVEVSWGDSLSQPNHVISWNVMSKWIVGCYLVNLYIYIMIFDPHGLII